MESEVLGRLALRKRKQT